MSDNNTTTAGFSHEKIETSNFLMIVLILLVVAIGGIVEIVPLFTIESSACENVGPGGRYWVSTLMFG